MAKPRPKTKPAAPKGVAGRSPASSKKHPATEPANDAESAEEIVAEGPHGRPDDGDAFMPDPGEGPARAPDVLAEVLAEDFLEAATRGNEVLEDELDRPLSEEVGGPFVLTNASEELADDVDESNPIDAEPAGRPQAVAGLVQRPRSMVLSDEDVEDESDEDVDPEDEDEEEEEEEVEGEIKDDDGRL